MQIKKRDGSLEPLNTNKVSKRVRMQCHGLSPLVDPDNIVIKVISGLNDGISTTEIDELVCKVASEHIKLHPDYARLASRIWLTLLEKQIPGTFYACVKQLKKAGYIRADFYEFCKDHATELNAMVVSERDDLLNYFGVKTLERAYLLRDLDGRILERPQYMFLRVAVELGMQEGLDWIKKTYDSMSTKECLHATPTLFNAGTSIGNLASCFLLSLAGDSHEGLAKTWTETTYFSKKMGGIGLHVHNLRAKGTPIKSTGRPTKGLVPLARSLNEAMLWFDQGGKRPGSLALYLMSEHNEFPEFVMMKRKDGGSDDKLRAKDLFYGCWMSSLFMENAERATFGLDDTHHLFCPEIIRQAGLPALQDVYGEAYRNLYNDAIAKGLSTRKIKAGEVFSDLIETQIMEGMPYMLHKDAINRKSNQANLGTIHSSNLCTEITLVSTSEEEAVKKGVERESAVCNLGSISALSLINKDKSINLVNAEKLTDLLVTNIDTAIDKNDFGMVESANYSNVTHRPIGIGLQGVADAFLRAMVPYDSHEALVLTKDMHEALYYYSLKASVKLAKTRGAYKTFNGSPASKGILQFDLWLAEYKDDIKRLNAEIKGLSSENEKEASYKKYLAQIVKDKEALMEIMKPNTSRFDWDGLKKEIKQYGLRNSMLLAPMPTASTSNIFGNTEAFEPPYMMMYVRETNAGEFFEINKWLVEALEDRGLWNEELSSKIKNNFLSLRNIPEIPDDIKAVFRTAWEVSQKMCIKMAAVRGAYICQSQSFNLFKAFPSKEEVAKMHLYAWRLGLKTGMYYLKSLSQGQGMGMITAAKKQLSGPAVTIEQSVPAKSTYISESASQTSVKMTPEAEMEQTLVATNAPAVESIVEVIQQESKDVASEESSLRTQREISEGEEAKEETGLRPSGIGVTPKPPVEVESAKPQEVSEDDSDEALLCSLLNPAACEACSS